VLQKQLYKKNEKNTISYGEIPGEIPALSIFCRLRIIHTVDKPFAICHLPFAICHFHRSYLCPKVYNGTIPIS